MSAHFSGIGGRGRSTPDGTLVSKVSILEHYEG